MRQFAWTFLVLLVWCFTIMAADKPKVEEFRKGIKTHQDWIERFRQTHDYRIFKMLACRAGSVADKDKAIEMSQWIQKNPDRLEEVFKKWRIIRDEKAYLAGIKEEWTTTYGKQALCLESAHYLVFGTQAHQDIAKLLSFYMEKVFKFYALKFSTGENVEGKFIVKLYPNERDFKASGGPEFAFAYFQSRSRVLAGYVPDNKDGRFGNAENLREVLVTTFFHEGFHQYLSYFVPDPPTWLNEGFAEIFRSLQINGRYLIEGNLINAYDLGKIKEFIKDNQHTPLKELVYMDQKTYYEKHEIHYPQGWSLVHFFVFGAKAYQNYYKNLMTHLKNGMDLEEAQQETFKKVDWNNLEAAWRGYVERLSSRTPKNSLITF